ncbi:hypothetical protein AX16_009915 [Volvariella volvacea WC 439]|nr:hypothetical protein AX16_009915 [Volvariella volvacea WC 439]
MGDISDKDDSSSGLEKSQWDPEREIAVRRKIDLTVLPLLTLGLFVFQLDRMNLASVLTGGFREQIGVNQNVVNLGNQLMFMGIVVLEIPSNMLLQKVGPQKYIAAQVLLFGLVASLQIFIRNHIGFLMSRLFLGFAEAGYIPGAIFTLSTWYTKDELARKVAIFFFGMFGGNAFSPLLGAGILRMEGAGGLRGWQWIFLLEGLFTILVSFFMIFLFPGTPAKPKAIVSLIKFEDDDIHILQERLKASHGGEVSTNGLSISPRKVWKTLTHWRRWPHFLATSIVFATWSPLTTYTPSIYVSLEFDRIAANALASIGGFLTLAVAFTFAYISDRTKKRGLTVAAAITFYLITLIVLRTVHPQVTGKWRRWALWTTVNSFAVGYHPVHNTWVQLNCKDPQERSISIAMWVMFAISGLMAGSQIFRQDDVPFYNKGVIIMIGMVAGGLFFWSIQMTIYYFHNKHVREGRHPEYAVNPVVWCLHLLAIVIVRASSFKLSS